MALPVFPTIPGITFPAKRSQVWGGTSQEALSGKRVRTSYRSYPTYNYELTFSFLRSSNAFPEWQQLAAFINSVNGPAQLWLFNDTNDNTATSQSFGTGDGVTTTFQLVRSLGGFVEPVFFPNAITNVNINGTPTAAYTLSAIGQVIFNSAPAAAAALTWNGTFYWPCRFDDDVTGFENMMSKLWELKALKFSTEKLP